MGGHVTHVKVFGGGNIKENGVKSEKGGVLI